MTKFALDPFLPIGRIARSVKANRPSLYAFSSYREYLSAFLAHTKRTAGTGLKELAQMAGFRSPSAMAMILSGKRRLSLPSAERLATAGGLNASEQKYLLLLVRLENALSPSEQVEIKEKLFLLKSRLPKSELSMAHYRVLAYWYYPAIYAMAATGDLEYSAARIAERLGPEISIREVKSAVGDLINIKLLELVENKLRQVHGPLTTQDEIRSVAVHRYHQSMLGRAQQALDLPLEEREFSGLTITVPPHRVAEVKEQIRQFRKQLSESLTPADPGNVYQLNLQFFPLARSEKKA